MLNAHNVLIGSPDQLVTGAGLTAPLGTDLPDMTDVTKAGVTLDEAFKDFGFITEDGISLTLDRSTEVIKDWGLNAVRRYLSEFNGKLSFSFMETNKNSLELIVGADHVDEVAASSTDGHKMMVEFGAWLPDARSWVFKIKDGSARVVIVLPNALVTSISEVTVNSTSAITWQVDVECNADANGTSIYIVTDDGVVSA